MIRLRSAGPKGNEVVRAFALFGLSLQWCFGCTITMMLFGSDPLMPSKL